MLWQLTVGVTGAGAGVDKVRQQKKLEATLRERLENAGNSPPSNARYVR